MGSALRTYKNKACGRKLADGKSTGRLTDVIIDRMQIYYGIAIRSNIGNLKAIQNAIWAIFFHIIMGPNFEALEFQHRFCLQGENSWCKYQVDKLKDTSTYNQSHCLPFTFRTELQHIFRRLINSYQVAKEE